MIVESELRSWLDLTAPTDCLQPVTTGRGGAQIWSLRSAGRSLYLKRYPEPRKLDQELRAYEEWLPASGLRAPRLVASERSLGVLLLEEVPAGRTIEGATLTSTQCAAAYRQAGNWLQRFHALPFEDRDPLPLGVALGQRFESWAQRADRLDVPEPDRQELLRLARVAWRDGRGLEGLRRTPCHRDFEARNWLLDDAQQLWVLDFEHAAPDAAILDLVRVWLTPGFDDFLSGYGHPPDPAQLRQLAALWGLATVVWARQHDDPRFESQGRLALARAAETA